MGNEGIYNVGKEFGKALFIFVKQRVSQVSRKMAGWHDSSTSSHVLYTWPFHRMLYSQAFHELVANCTNLLCKLDSSPISDTYPLQINPHKYRKMIE